MSGGSNEPAASVVVVEDEPALLEEVVAFLSARGFSVQGARDGGALWRLFGEQEPDAVVLDLGLPGEDGVTIAAELRRRAPAIGIVMMTARGALHERIVGYETGANIYLVKPVDLGELIAAVRSTLRTLHPKAEAARDAAPRWTLDRTTWRLVAPDGRSIQLSRAETQLLERLTRQPGVPVSRVEIGGSMGKSDDLSEHRYVDQVIRRLRRKIEAQLAVEPPIGAAHSQGYYFMAEVDRHGQ